MYIKTIVLDGFKSYGKRTEITGFDQQFNAITGLNGTGKSNILDAICFVLGISQLSNVRVGTLQDLVYKSGQSNVTKATVSITFDNTDKTQAPVNFVEYGEITVTRQVMIGGANKYLINGTIVPTKRVIDLFTSAKLNVNNPHFLIMQGRVTKVLNMKPPEILGMIEEAAGTRTYDSKRSQTQKTIEKKELKFHETSQVSEEEIQPKLNKLREEKKMFLEYQRIERELEHTTSIYAAWQFVQVKKVMEKTLNDLENKQAHVKLIEEKIVQNKNSAEEIVQKVAEHNAKDTDKNEELKVAESKLKEKEKLLANINAQEKTAKENVVAEEKKLKQLVKSLSDDENSLKSKDAEMTKLSNMFQSLRDAEATDSAAFIASQKKYEAISAGMEIGDDGEAATLQELLISAKQNAALAATDIKKASMELEHCQCQLKEKDKELKTLSVDFRKDKAGLDNLQSQVNNIQRSLENLHYDQNKVMELKTKIRLTIQDIRQLQERLERFEAQYPQTKFEYIDPEKNFNRRCVKGVVCKLLKLKDYNTALALETGAGGRLFNVVVDNEITSKKLLKNGQLKYRTTIIPLNKIKGSYIKPTVASYAQRLVGNENVQTALSLISYDKELQAAMEYIFGGFFVCRDLNIARKVAFDENIMCTCVTLDGDVVNPAGVLSGGSVNKSGSFFVLLREYNEQLKTLRTKEQELRQMETDLEKFTQAEEKYIDLKRRYELRCHELAVCQQRIQQTTHYYRQEEVDNLKRKIAELTEIMKTRKEMEKVNNAKATEIQNKIMKSKGSKETQLQEAEDEMKVLKKKAENSKKLWKQKEQDYEGLKLEIKDLQQAIINDKEQIQKCEESIIELKQKCEEAAEATKETKTEVTSLQIEYKELKVTFAAKNKEIQKMLQQKTELLTQISEYELEIKKRSHDIAQLEAKCNEYKSKEREMGKRMPDKTQMREIEEMDEKSGIDLGKRIKRMQEQRDTLRRNVNLKAQNKFEQEEKEYLNLKNRKDMINADKLKMLSVIEDLDKKKEATLSIAYKQISKDFGRIFSTLLPGTTAKLQAPENRSFLEGLEIKVNIGGIWKDSLNELSGGQKSLVALSLILAMLLFKPAPIYILDEVDAALDLSHTQNIGTMLRKHFNHSQFIIVSLKDGMFNNANVLFRTQFVDGMSAVTRTVNRSKH